MSIKCDAFFLWLNHLIRTLFACFFFLIIIILKYHVFYIVRGTWICNLMAKNLCLIWFCQFFFFFNSLPSPRHLANVLNQKVSSHFDCFQLRFSSAFVFICVVGFLAKGFQIHFNISNEFSCQLHSITLI
jgi:hypothetical protein